MPRKSCRTAWGLVSVVFAAACVALTKSPASDDQFSVLLELDTSFASSANTAACFLAPSTFPVMIEILPSAAVASIVNINDRMGGTRDKLCGCPAGLSTAAAPAAFSRPSSAVLHL